ncbi:hypothetical protein [Phaffia rhodozyma]|uniref:Uncharacterized protein n=1 Tax=Phaffia rhodozyma TaxID=264483 RepID=A0A0F7SRW9_PHARH|nr:hypothetical protein [Phaffia rhodozyma]
MPRWNNWYRPSDEPPFIKFLLGISVAISTIFILLTSFVLCCWIVDLVVYEVQAAGKLCLWDESGGVTCFWRFFVGTYKHIKLTLGGTTGISPSLLEDSPASVSAAAAAVVSRSGTSAGDGYEWRANESWPVGLSLGGLGASAGAARGRQAS